MTWLNRNVLVGFTDKRGTAWHYRAADQGDESNHYPGPIPIEDVRRRLFHWTAEKHLSAALVPTGAGSPEGPYGEVIVDGPDGPAVYRVIVFPQDAYWLRSDTAGRLGHHGHGYEGHQYADVLLDGPATLISDSELGIASAGLLKGGARAWVQIELPDTIETPSGFSFRPSLLAMTSFDSSSVSKYRIVAGVVVCDNTLDMAMLEKVPEVKVRHSRYSQLKVMEARQALGIIFKAGEAFEKAVAELVAWKVTDDEFQKIIADVHPVAPDAGKAGQTIAGRRRDQLSTMWTADERVAPWRGTALGVVQAFNTYAHHAGTIRNVGHRAERNMANLLLGGVAKQDAKVLRSTAKVTHRSLAGVAAALEAG
jgi:phage/plasmid-like protein (TIGR03299 family)